MLFESKTPAAFKVRRKIVEETEDQASEVCTAIKAAVKTFLPTIDWHLPNRQIPGFQVNVSVVNAIVESIAVQPESVRVWLTSQAHDACVAEIAIDVNVALSLMGEIWVDKPGNHQEVASGAKSVDRIVEIKVFVEFAGKLLDSGVNDWNTKIGLADVQIHVDIGKAPFDPPSHGIVPYGSFFGNINFDDDIPF